MRPRFDKGKKKRPNSSRSPPHIIMMSILFWKKNFAKQFVFFSFHRFLFFTDSKSWISQICYPKVFICWVWGRGRVEALPMVNNKTLWGFCLSHELSETPQRVLLSDWLQEGFQKLLKLPIFFEEPGSEAESWQRGCLPLEKSDPELAWVQKNRWGVRS